MGSYLNPSSESFQTGLRSEIYIDKSLLIAQVNRRVRTEQRFICVSRPRRFGKSMAAEMLSAYYGCKEDTSALFENLKIVSSASYKEHLNRYDVKTLDDYKGNLLLVGINYDKEKSHTCVIEKVIL